MLLAFQTQSFGQKVFNPLCVLCSRRGRGGRRGRRRKREETGEEEKRETEDEDAHHANGVDSSISESVRPSLGKDLSSVSLCVFAVQNEVLESSPAAPKKAKVAEEATSEDSVKTAPVSYTHTHTHTCA